MFAAPDAYVFAEVMDMVGQLTLVRGKGHRLVERGMLGPVAVLRGTVFEPDGLPAWRLARRIRRAERALVRMGVGRVVLGPDFPYAQRLTMLRLVDPLPMWRGVADVLGLGALAAQGIPPARGRVALSAPRLCPELTAAAERLCPQVRALVIDTPGGADYARFLQNRFGLPVSPPAAGADVTAAFGPGGGRWGHCLELYGQGHLGGLQMRLEGVELPDGCGDQVLALLWERGELNRERLCTQIIDIVGAKG